MVKFYKETLLYNIIDRKFQNMLYPLNAAMYLIFLPKYTVINNFVTPNSKLRKALSSVGTVFFVLTALYRFYSNFESTPRGNLQHFSIYKFALFFDLIFYSTGCVVIFISNLRHDLNNVHLILNIQKGMRGSKTEELSRLKLWNWLTICAICVVYLWLICYDYKVSFDRILHVLPFIYFDLNIIYAISILWVIQASLDVWIADAQRLFLLEVRDEAKLRGSVLFERIANILEAFDLCKKVFASVIIVHVCEVFLHALLYFQFNIELEKLEYNNSTTIFVVLQRKWKVLTWTCKNWAQLVMLCGASGRVHGALIRARVVCGEARGSVMIPVEIKQMCKKVNRLCSMCRAMTPCGVVSVDSGLTLRLATTLTVYFVVLLQFAFTKT